MTADRPALELAAGFVASDVAAEFPGLRLDSVTIAARRGASTRALADRLRGLANRYHGATVVAMRTKPIPHAYRAFYRQIGLDPDVERVPAERAAVQRLMGGGFRSVDLIADACLLALLETGVPVWALDADRVAPPGLGIRAAAAGDFAAGEAASLAPGTLVVADGRTVHGRLFDNPGAAAPVGPRTTRVLLFSVAVDGVPRIHVQEALWTCAESIEGAGGE